MIYIFGHKKPDTDSICASISLSYLKNQLGYKTEAKTLGSLNNETRFVLKYFQMKEPKYLNDVKLQIKDLDYIKNCFVNEKESINNSYLYMKSKGLSGLPIVNDNKKLTGLVTLKELSKEIIEGEFTKLNTSYDNIVDTLKGKEIFKFDEEIKGNLLVASFRSTTFMNEVTLKEDDILIVGDRQSILEYAFKSKVKLVIVVGDCEINENNLKRAKENRVNVIKTGFDTFHAAKLINLSNYIKDVSFSNSPISFNNDEYYTTFQEVSNKTHHTNYPVVNKNGECLGLLPITRVNIKNPKTVILVDHNEKEQSVDGLEEANIVEIIDHHKLGSIATNLPINFRNMAVGSTNTIIYNLYKENDVPIPQDIAGMMLSGILSDTLLLKSPTTTEVDVEAVNYLEKIAKVNYRQYGLAMFEAGSSLKGKTKEEIIYEDFKKFHSGEIKIGIGIVSTTSPRQILNEQEEYVNILNNISINKGYDVVLLFVTDIINNGSYVLFNDSSKEIVKSSFNLDDIYEGVYLKNIVSRKKQIIPVILENLEKI